jgi:hypothetical protein
VTSLRQRHSKRSTFEPSDTTPLRVSTEGLAYVERREPIGELSLFFRHRENSGDSTHAEPHFRTSCHYQNIFLTRSFSKHRLKRKGFREMLRLPWAQEAPGSNPGAPTTNLLNYLSIFLRGISTTIELGNIWEQLVSMFTASLWALPLACGKLPELLPCENAPVELAQP